MHGRDRHPPRGRGSNYERKEWCEVCRARTTHLYDHGLGHHICARHELGHGRDDDPHGFNDFLGGGR